MIVLRIPFQASLVLAALIGTNGAQAVKYLVSL